MNPTNELTCSCLSPMRVQTQVSIAIGVAVPIICMGAAIAYATTGSFYLCVVGSVVISVIASLAEAAYLVNKGSCNTYNPNHGFSPSNSGGANSSLNVSEKDCEIHINPELQRYGERIRRWLNSDSCSHLNVEQKEEILTRIVNCFVYNTNDLNLGGYGLTSFPEPIYNLSNLRELDLSNNSISVFCALPDHLKNLTKLNLRNNRLSRSFRSILVLKNLKELDITNNPIAGDSVAMDSMKGLNQNLKIIWSTDDPCSNLVNAKNTREKGCKIQVSPELQRYGDKIRYWLNSDSCSHLNVEQKEEILTRIVNCFVRNTNDLNLGGYGLTSFPEPIYNLSNLRELDLSNNNFGSLSWSISNLSNLTNLNLSNNNLTSFPKPIYDLSNLMNLNLSNNSLSRLLGLIRLPNNLRELDLSNNHFGSLPSSVRNLINLTNLNLSNNNLTSFSMLTGELSALMKLDLSDNSLNWLPQSIMSLRNLGELNLRDNLFMSVHSIIGSLNVNCIIRYSRNPLNGAGLTPQQAMSSSSAEQIFRSLCDVAGKNTIELKNLFEPDLLENSSQKQKSFENWLERLNDIGDFGNKGLKRQELAKLIVDAICRAEGDKDYRQVFFSCILDAHTDCGDKMALSLLYLGINEQITQAVSRKDLGSLAHLLGHGSWALSLLEDVARTTISVTNTLNEEAVEVYLAYPIRLKKRLDLPIVLESMRFFGSSGVIDANLDFAESFVNQSLCNREAYFEMLVKSEIWLQALETCEKKQFGEIKKVRDEAIDKLDVNDKDYLTKYADVGEGIYEKKLIELSEGVLQKKYPAFFQHFESKKL